MLKSAKYPAPFRVASCARPRGDRGVRHPVPQERRHGHEFSHEKLCQSAVGGHELHHTRSCESAYGYQVIIVFLQMFFTRVPGS